MRPLAETCHNQPGRATYQTRPCGETGLSFPFTCATICSTDHIQAFDSNSVCSPNNRSTGDLVTLPARCSAHTLVNSIRATYLEHKEYMLLIETRGTCEGCPIAGHTRMVRGCQAVPRTVCTRSCAS